MKGSAPMKNVFLLFKAIGHLYRINPEKLTTKDLRKLRRAIRSINSFLAANNERPNIYKHGSKPAGRFEDPFVSEVWLKVVQNEDLIVLFCNILLRQDPDVNKQLIALGYYLAKTDYEDGREIVQ